MNHQNYLLFDLLNSLEQERLTSLEISIHKDGYNYVVVIYDAKSSRFTGASEDPNEAFRLATKALCERNG